MSLELWNTIFSGATFVVIAATAIAALIQLRHLRASNQMNALLNLMNLWFSEDLQGHYHYLSNVLPRRLVDPGYLDAVREGPMKRSEHRELFVGDFWEQIGTYMKYGLLDERSWLDIASAQLIISWEQLEPVIKALRERAGSSAFENFEYAAVRARLWQKHHPNGSYPANMPRMADLKNRQ